MPAARSKGTATRKAANPEKVTAGSAARAAAANGKRLASLPPPADDLPLNTATAVINEAKRSKRARTSEPEPPKPKRHADRAGKVKAINGTSEPAERPLFSARAARANFNPLPAPDPITKEASDRCANPLNKIVFPAGVERFRVAPAEDRVVLIFGSGDMAQMGKGPDDLDPVYRPTVHPGLEQSRTEGKLGQGGVAHVAIGGLHSLIVDGAGHAWSWGVNDAAALGRQTEGVEDVTQEELESRPGQVAGLPPRFLVSRVAAGDSVSVAISREGELRAWGNFRANEGNLGFDGNVGTDSKQLVPLRVQNVSQWPVAQAACGYNHVLALTTEGSVYTWGTGQQHQLGRKIVERRIRNGLFPERLGLKKVVLVGAGGHHSFAVVEDGTVYGWGLNTWRQLGINPSLGGNDDIVSTPTPITSLHPSRHGGARVVAVEGGDFYSIFLFSNGDVFTVGCFENSELGLAPSHPLVVAQKQRIGEGKAKQKAWIEEEMRRRKAVAEAAGEAWDMTKDITESADAAYKAVSLGYVPPMAIAEPVKVTFPTLAEGGGGQVRIVDISAGPRNLLAVDADGKAYSWGLSENEALGFGEDTDQQDVPRLLKSKGLQGVKVVKCAAGAYASMLVGVRE